MDCNGALNPAASPGRTAVANYVFAGQHLQSSVPVEPLPPWVPEWKARPCIIVRTAKDTNHAGEPFMLRHAWPGDRGGMTVYAAESGAIRITFQDKAAFRISGHEGPSCVDIEETSPTQRTVAILLNQVLPRVLAHRGAIVLHAALVKIGDRAILLVGETGTGKSTLAAALMQRGAALLTDDCCLLTCTPSGSFARPTYRSLRLWPDSARQLFDEDLRNHPQSVWKREMRLRQQTNIEPVHIDRIYVLTGELTEHVSFRPLSKPDACLALVRNALHLDVSDAKRAAAALPRIAHVVNTCPVAALVYPMRYDVLTCICENVMSGTLKQRGQMSWI